MGHEGYTCSKCNLKVHENCIKLVYVDCTQRRESGQKRRNQMSFSESFLQFAVHTRLTDIKRAYPQYLEHANEFFLKDKIDTFAEIKRVQQEYLSNGIPEVKTKLHLNIKYAKNLVAKDSGGTSDPYVTVYLGGAFSKKTQTQFKTLNPVWDEVLEFEYLNTAEGINGLNGETMNMSVVIVVRDEDVGITAKVGKFLANEGHFLGQVILNLNNLVLNCDQEYVLHKRTNADKINGTIVINATLVSNIFANEFTNKKFIPINSYLQQYAFLNRKIFKHIFEKNFNENDDNENWLLEYVASASSKKSIVNNECIYFQNRHFNQILRHFSNKYSINEIYMKIVHFNELYDYFIDLALIKRLQEKSFIKREITLYLGIFKFFNETVKYVYKYYQNLKLHQFNELFECLNNDYNALKEFNRKMLILPQKLLCLIVNYRSYYPFDMNMIQSAAGKSSVESQLIEFYEIVQLFFNSCLYLNKYYEETLEVDSDDNEKLKQIWFSLLKISDECKKEIMNFNFSVTNQLLVLELCVIESLKNFMTLWTYRLDELACQQNSPELVNDEVSFKRLRSYKLSIGSCIERIDDMFTLISDKIPEELNLQEKLFSCAFSPIIPQERFNFLCTKILMSYAFYELKEILEIDIQSLEKMRPEHIRAHINLYILVKDFYASRSDDIRLALQSKEFDKTFEKIFDAKLTSILNLEELCQLFQPFLLEFINLQDDQFIKYMNNMHEVEKLQDLIRKLSSNDKSKGSMRSHKIDLYELNPHLLDETVMKSIEKYYSPSITDLFTIFYEILKTIMHFHTSNTCLNAIHQASFARFVKNKILSYLILLKNEFYTINPHLESLAFNSSTFSLLKQKLNNSNINDLGQNVLSLILMNNFYKVLEFVNELELQLANGSNLDDTVRAQLKSLRSILNQDLFDMLKIYSLEYCVPITKACESISVQLNEKLGETYDDVDDMNILAFAANLISSALFDLLNDKFYICSHVLFEEIFKELLENTFKITIRIYEQSIVTKQSEVYWGEHAKNKQLQDSSFRIQVISKLLQLISSDKQNNKEDKELKISDNEKSTYKEIQYKAVKSGLDHIVDFFSADEILLNRNYLIKIKEYEEVLKSIELFLKSTNELIRLFINTQKSYQNLFDMKEYGKMHFLMELTQHPQHLNEFNFRLYIVEVRELDKTGFNIDSNKALPIIEVVAITSSQNENYKKKFFKACEFIKQDQVYTYSSNQFFEFKINLSKDCLSSKRCKIELLEHLREYELEFLVKDSLNGKNNIIGVAIVDLLDSFKSQLETENADELLRRDSYHLNISLDLWVPIKYRVQTDELGSKILQTLETHKKDKKAVEFINLKRSMRSIPL